MVTSIQDSRVPYRPGYDIIIPHGPEPVRALKARDETPSDRASPYRPRLSYTYTAPETDCGGIYSATGTPAALAVDTVGRIIDIRA